MALHTGTRVYGYTLEHRIGSGGFADVWASRSLVGPPRGVAVKILRPPVTDLARARLVREIDVHARVRHPSVCRLEDVLPDRSGIVLELLTGPSLATRLATGPLGIDEAIPIFCELFHALHVVHDAGVVHRDVTPANVVFDGPSRAKLVDFGVAKIATMATLPTTALTTDETALGSWIHQAPEQIEDPRLVDGRADLYGLGSTLFAALAGRAAFRAPTPAMLLALKSTREAPTLSEVTGRPWPRDIESLIGSLLARDPGRRPASAGEAADRLARVRRA